MKCENTSDNVKHNLNIATWRWLITNQWKIISNFLRWQQVTEEHQLFFCPNLVWAPILYSFFHFVWEQPCWCNYLYNLKYFFTSLCTEVTPIRFFLLRGVERVIPLAENLLIPPPGKSPQCTPPPLKSYFSPPKVHSPRNNNFML